MDELLRVHTPCHVRLGALAYWVVWYSDDTDGVATGRNGFVRTWSSSESLRQDCVEVDLDASVELDLGTVLTPPRATPDCKDILDIWNFLTDVHRTVGLPDFERVAPRRTVDRVYGKIFSGCNLPTLTPKGQTYNPVWTRAEERVLRRVLQKGIAAFSRVVQPAA